MTKRQIQCYFQILVVMKTDLSSLIKNVSQKRKTLLYESYNESMLCCCAAS